MIVPVSEAI